jgi:hypothetical protein
LILKKITLIIYLLDFIFNESSLFKLKLNPELVEGNASPRGASQGNRGGKGGKGSLKI